MVSIRFCLALLLAGGLCASCVAQEAYKPNSGSGGATGQSSSGVGGLVVTPPDEGAGVGGLGEGSGPPVEAACRTSDECALPYPYCQVAIGRCVECLSNRNCAGTGRTFCESNTGTCVVCLQNTQCPHTLPYCADSLGECVECLTSANCGTAGYACDRDSYHCVPSCHSNADCADSPATPYCDPERNLCVACITDDACPGTAPRCYLPTKSCVKCLAEEDCSGITPRCDTRKHTCVQCITNQDCQPGVSCVAGNCANPG